MSLSGLSSAEVLERRQRGEGNNTASGTSRTYGEIVRSNVLNPINLVLFVVGAVLIAVGRFSDAAVSVGLILINVLISTYQEIRAKRQLDRIALLTRPRASVVRDGQEATVDPAELVRGDLIAITPGDQIVVDGTVIGEGRVEVDESLLTGESDPIVKTTGDEVLSGSFVLTGSANYEATRVGEASFANKITASARKFEMTTTPLQRQVNLILRLLMVLAAFIGGLMLVAMILSRTPLVRQVQMVAIVAGLVPNGLLFMVILAYALGAVRIVRQGALVQQANAVESLSNVTVVCTDKTGTLTANRIRYQDVYPASSGRVASPAGPSGLANGTGTEAADSSARSEVERLLGDFAASATTRNKTSEALAAALPGVRRPLADEVPFSSARKWSALAFAPDGAGGPTVAYVLGALEMLEPHLAASDAARQKVAEWSNEGFRVLVFAGGPAATGLHDERGEPSLPGLELLGIVCLGDELRPHLLETLQEFDRAGVQLKVISGDNPQTVVALARQAGLSGDLRYVAGPDLVGMSDGELRRVAAETTVFGRITPDQKQALVGALRAQGHYVAMIGDGVNDVLSLKKADLGIAMESGSSATRAVADMVLLGDSFGALPPAFTEGQRIVNGMSDILRLFLTRVLYSALLIVGVAVLGLGFPFLPKQNALLVFLSVGIPTFALALWARPGVLKRRSVVREISHFVLPAATLIFVFGILVYAAAFQYSIVSHSDFNISPQEIRNFERYTGQQYDIVAPDRVVAELAHLVAQTSLAVFLVLAGLVLVVFVEPPHPWFAGGDELSPDRRPTILAGALLGLFVVILLVEPLRAFFEMVLLPLPAYALIVLAVTAWVLVQRQAWRGRWLQRLLDLEF